MSFTMDDIDDILQKLQLQTSGKVDKNLLFGKKYRENWPCVSSQIQPSPPGAGIYLA